MLISIIITVYNTEKYLERCLKSVLEQSSTDFEVVIVDDYSSDNSMMVIEKTLEGYEHKPEIKIIKNEKNQGSSYSRTVGLNSASGDYVIFIDSDDYISPSYISELKTCIEQHRPDIIIFGCEQIWANRKAPLSVCFDAANKDEALAALLSNKMHNSLCNKLFKRSLFTSHPEIALPADLNVLEDKSICFKLFYYAQSVRFIDKVLYYYDRTREHSITNAGQARNITPSIQVVEIIDDFFSTRPCSKVIQDAILSNKLHLLGLVALYASKQERREVFAQIGKIPFMSYVESKAIPLHYRLAAMSCQYHVPFFAWILKKSLFAYQRIRRK